MSFNTVINVTDGLNGYNLDPGYTADVNTYNLQQILNYLLSSSSPAPYGEGGTLLFPVGNGAPYNFDGTVYIGAPDGMSSHGTNWSVVIRGSAQGKLNAPNQALIKQNADDDSNWHDLFVVNTNSGDDDDIGGVTFEDIMIEFAATAPNGNAAVRVVNGSQNCRLHRVSLVNCPIGVALKESLQASIIDCTIYNAANAQYGVELGEQNNNSQAVETYITGTTFLSTSGGTALQIWGAEHLRMSHCRVESWTNGIVIQVEENSGNAEQLYFSNVSCITAEGAASLSVEGGSSGAYSYIGRVWFAECEFVPGGANAGSYTGGGVIIGTTDTYDIIDGVRFVDCHSCLWAGPGIDIQGATNTEILGGYYSCNGNTSGEAPTPGNKSGIKVSNDTNGLRISGPACNNSLFVFEVMQADRGYASLTQEYGIYVSNGAKGVRISDCDLTGNNDSGLWVDGSSSETTNVFVKDCDLTGYSSPATPVTVSATVVNLQIVDCPGYNDSQTVALRTSLPSGVFSAPTYAYYGPSSFYVGANTGASGGVTAILINGITTELKVGAFFLAAGQTAQVTISGSPTIPFSMIGQ